MELWKRGYHGYHGYIVLKQSGHFIMVVLQGFYIYLSLWKDRVICSSLLTFSKTLFIHYYRPPEGGRLYDMKVVSGYAFLRTYYV